jgi:branched-chain amino acid aminotransferase
MYDQLWFNGEFRKVDSAKCSLLEHGLHYGTGVFEGIRCYETSAGPAIFRLREHLLRMKEGAQTLGLEFDVELVQRATLELVSRNKCTSAYVRPLTYFGGGGLGLDVDTLETFSMVATLPWKSHLGERARNQGISMGVSKIRRNSCKALPPLKLCGGYVNSVLAKKQAGRNGFEEALFVDDDGYVVEATGENIFYVRGGNIYAVDHPDALPGITRSTIITLSNATRKRTTLEELMNADEIFVTGTSAEVAGVNRLDDRHLNIGPFTRDLQTSYQDLVHGRDTSYAEWLTRP